jgi:PAS domain S-box-containing protein
LYLNYNNSTGTIIVNCAINFESVELSKIEEQIIRLFRFSHLGFQLFKIDGRRLILTGANHAADEILGTDHARYMGKCIEEVVPVKENPGLLDEFYSLVKNGPALHKEHTIIEGKKIINAFQICAFKVSSQLLLATYFDIAERIKNESQLKNKIDEYITLTGQHKAHEKEKSSIDRGCVTKLSEIQDIISRLEQSETRQALALEATNDGIWDYSPVSKKIYFSPRWFHMLGYRKDRFPQTFETFLDLVFDDDRDYVSKEITTFVKNKDTYLNMEFRMKAHDGMVRWIQSRAKSVEKDEKGNILRIIGTHIDITDRKLEELSYQQQNEALKIAEEKLKSQNTELRLTYEKLLDSEEKFRQLAENSNDIFWLRSKHEILYLNSAFEKIWDRSRKEVIDNPGIIRQWIHPEDKTTFHLWPDIENKAKNGYYTEQYRIIKPGGEVRWIWARIYPIYNENKEFYRIAGIATDVTEQKNIEQELRIAKIKAQESDRLKTSFLANISHEIRTPMNGIVGFTQMIREGNIDSRLRKEYENVIYLSTRQLLHIIDDIVDISKIEANQLTINKTSFNINELISELQLFFERELSASEKEPDISLSSFKELGDQECNIVTDQDRLRQIMNNLIDNAIKFTKRGEIKFGYTLSDNNFQFFVEDTGIGIDEELYSIIFEYFRQADEGHTRQYGGTGLGLPIAKGLVELLGGEIWVESKKGIGTTFYFSLPHKFVDIEKKEEPKKEEAPRYNWHDKKILVVEDDDLNYAFLEAVISQTNAIIIRAENGHEALSKCKEAGLDIILLDIRLPEMDGFEFVRQLRKSGIKIPVIAQTAYAMSGDKHKCFDAGCNDYIAKPLKKNELLKKMSNFL